MKDIKITAEQAAYVRVLFRREREKDNQLRSFSNIAREFLATNEIEGSESWKPSRLGVELCTKAGIEMSPGILQMARRDYGKQKDDGERDA